MHISGFILHKSFEKQYSKQLSNVKKNFLERRNMLLIDPAHPILSDHALTGRYQGCRSINITGDIRAIYKMQGTIAIFLWIGTHPQLYG
jgi:addiction module RelE/StbE family toxin